MGRSVYHLYIFIHYNGCINIPLLKGSQSVTIMMNYSAPAHGCTGWTKHLEQRNQGVRLMLRCECIYIICLCFFFVTIITPKLCVKGSSLGGQRTFIAGLLIGLIIARFVSNYRTFSGSCAPRQSHSHA